MPSPPPPRSPQTRRALRWALAAVLALVLVPYLLVPLYAFGHPVSTLMLGRWLLGRPVERIWMPIDQIAPALPLAVMAAEDARFCSHHGIDLKELREAVADADELADLRGGSTVTQQVAKNLFLWPGRSYLRKALEAPLALWIDLVLPKRRIMEIYLNVAEWGPHGEFGAEAGARRAFAKPASRLTQAEAALLAAILPNPVRRDARQPRRGLTRLANLYAARSRAVGGLAGCLQLTRR